MEADAGIGQITAGLDLIAEAVGEIVQAAREVEPRTDEPVAELVRAGIEQLGRAAQAVHGQLLMLLAEGDRLGIAPGGIGPWLATVLDCTEGRARMLAADARTLASVPEWEAEVCSGRIGQDTLRAMARTVKATRKTDLQPVEEVGETLRIAREQGAKAGLERVRVLEERIRPGTVKQRHAAQRERSFARFGAVGDGGMCWFEVLLDPLRAAILLAAIELQTSAFIRARQLKEGELVPQDVRTTEQMNAEAITRLAQVFLDAPPEQRGTHFSIPTLAVTMQDTAATDPKIPAGCAITTLPGTMKDLDAPTEQRGANYSIPTLAVTMKDLDAPAEQRGVSFSVPTLAVTMQDSAATDPEVPAGWAVTTYGALIPASSLPPQGNPRRKILHVKGETGTLDGESVDQDPTARLASPAQRTYLTWRDRTCRYPGCDRPITYGLNAHHKTSYAQGGETTVRNMVLYCSQHHTTIHQHAS